jgi:hypothetical protein
MNFDFATITQSLRSITKNLYSTEKFSQENNNESKMDKLKEKLFQEQLRKQYQENVKKLYNNQVKNPTTEKNYTLLGNEIDSSTYDSLTLNNTNFIDKTVPKDNNPNNSIVIKAIDMDLYNDQIYKEQNERAQKNREMIAKQNEDTLLEKTQRQEKLKQREQKEKDLFDEKAWNGLKNDWYWGSYSDDVKKSSYTNVDNYMDKLNPSAYSSIPLSKDYKVIGDYKVYEKENAGSIDKPFLYKSPFRDYVYDVKNNRLIPNETNVNITPIPTDIPLATTLPTLTTTPTPSTPSATPMGTPLSTPNETPNETPIGTPLPLKEGFADNNIDVDPKLFEIYQKTITSDKKNTVSYDVDYTYNYVFVLIIIIVLFLLFKSS